VTSTVVACDRCGRKNRVPDAAPGSARCAQCRAPLTWIVDASDATFASVVEAARLPVLLDLWAPWCGPCRMVSPALERLAHELAGRLKLVKVDVDTSPRTAERFAVQGIPTLLLLQQGEVVARQTGAAPEDALRRWILASLPPAGDAGG
jgi:thioredoxin 2